MYGYVMLKKNKLLKRIKNVWEYTVHHVIMPSKM